MMTVVTVILVISVCVAVLQAQKDCYSKDECDTLSTYRTRRNYQPCIPSFDRADCYIPSRCVNPLGMVCMNNARCLPPDPSIARCYYPYCCQCLGKYDGEHCQWNSPATCSNNICLNGGTCSFTSDGLYCRCAAGYGGWHCAIQKPCRQFPCPANATCQEHSRGRKGRSCTASDGTMVDDDI